MKYYEVIILPSAERDIDEAFDWLADHKESAAVLWYDRLVEIILSLKTFPDRGSLAPESKFLNEEIRELFHGRRQHKYRILLTVKGNKVYVLHVRHGARLALGENDPTE